MKGQPKPVKMTQYKGNLNGGNSMKMGTKAAKSMPKRGMRAAKAKSCGCH